MHRFSPLSATIRTVSTQLLIDERIVAEQDGVGLYDGKEKSSLHDNGKLILTNYRLIFLNSNKPLVNSCFLDLELVRKTEYWVGLITSSPKITLFLGDPIKSRSMTTSGNYDRNKHNPSNESSSSRLQTFPGNDDSNKNNNTNTTSNNKQDEPDKAVLDHPAAQTWICRVCAFKNQFNATKCQLCGIAYDPSSSPSIIPKSTSAPTSRPGSAKVDDDRHSTTAGPGSSSASSSYLGNKFSQLSTTDVYSNDSPTSTSNSTPAMTPVSNSLLDYENENGNGNGNGGGDEESILESEPTNQNNQQQQQEQQEQVGISCPMCTFLNHPSMFRCEICDSVLSSKDPQLQSQEQESSNLRSRSSTLPSTSKFDSSASASADANTTTFIRLSFRKGGIGPFYNQLKTSLKAKEWDYNTKLMKPNDSLSSNTPPPNSSIGIDGILRAINMNAKERTEGLQDALQDLDRLMVNAQQMVSLAQTLNNKLSANKAEDNDDVTFIRTSLLNLGILSTDALTEDMVKDDQRYHEELAKELAHVLSFVMGPVPQKRGVIPLDEVYCIWNRARGIALVSPRDLVISAGLLGKVSKPTLNLFTFKSGRKIIHTPQYHPTRFKESLLSRLNQFELPSCITTLEIAKDEQLSPALTTELLESLEDQGVIVRDEASSTDGILWWPNLFMSICKNNNTQANNK